jgi:pectate lyase
MNCTEPLLHLSFEIVCLAMECGTSAKDKWHSYLNKQRPSQEKALHSRIGAQVLVEGNVFSNTKVPLTTNLDNNLEGYAVERNNLWGNPAPDITKTESFTSPPYTYSIENVDRVSAIVKAGAGQTEWFP